MLVLEVPAAAAWGHGVIWAKANMSKVAMLEPEGHVITRPTPI